MFVACDPDDPTDSTDNGKTTYTITAQANNAEWGTVTGGGVIDSGMAATLTATPNAGYDFVNWTMPDGTNSTNNPLIVVATANATYTANFAEQAGVKVTFGSTTWDAQYINAQYSASAKTFDVTCTQSTDPASYPMARVAYTFDGNVEPGTFTGAPTVDIDAGTAQRGNPWMWYFTPDDNMQLGGVACGDYWNKNLTLNVTAIDVTAMKLSLVANSAMGYLPECLQGTEFQNTTEQTMTMQVSNVNLTAAKASIANNNGMQKIALR